MYNRLRFNWGIYESDIRFFGGDVVYTGNIMARSRRSVVEEAEIILADSRCTVWMERFRHGNAALIGFVQDGKLLNKNEFKSCFRAHGFLDAFESCSEHSDVFAELFFFRRLKQSVTGIFQFLCILALVISLALHRVSYINIAIAVLSGVLLVYFGSLYKYYRNVDPATYKPHLTDNSDDEVD